MIKSDEFMPYAPDIPGQTKRINHSSASCQGSSLSMTIRMDDHGNVRAKCWRCGETGIKKQVKPSMHPQRVLKNKRHSYEMPDDIVYDWEKMPVESVAYLNKFKFTERELIHYGVGWSFKEDALIFPATNLGNLEAGWQAKYFGKKQRYSTITRVPPQMYSHFLSEWATIDAPSTVVITEDLLSAVKVRRARVLSSFALLGTELGHTALNEITKFHQRFYVWLDNDNAIVNKKARQIRDQLSLYGDAILIRELQEPKELTSQEICGVLYKYHRK